MTDSSNVEFEKVILSRASYDSLIYKQIDANNNLVSANEFIENLILIINYLVSAKRKYDSDPVFVAMREIASALNMEIVEDDKEGVRIKRRK